MASSRDGLSSLAHGRAATGIAYWARGTDHMLLHRRVVDPVESEWAHLPFEWDGHSDERGHVFIRHRGGLWWHEVPTPGPDHRCWVQTEDVGRVQRCACGALRDSDRKSWLKPWPD